MSSFMDNLKQDDEPDKRLSQGTLSFSDNLGFETHLYNDMVNRSMMSSSSAITSSVSISSGIDSSSQKTRDSEFGVKFDINSVRPMSEGQNDKKYVAYNIKVCKDGILPDPNPAEIERRYTDFHSLFFALRQEYPTLMSIVLFPKKVLLGNFTIKLVMERVVAFENLLGYICSHERLRESSAMIKFLQGNEMQKVNSWISGNEFNKATPLLENMFRLLNKIYTDRHPCVITTLCRLIACSNAEHSTSQAHYFADLALHRYEAISDADLLVYYVPLLQMCVGLWWAKGKDKKPLEERLCDMKRRGIKVDGCPSLFEAFWGQNN